MTTHNISNTYKFLYDFIIGDLLSQICKDIRFCVRDENIPFIIGENFEKYREYAIKNMSKDRLDRHKLASCICGAIIESKPLVGFNGSKIPKNANEALALYVGLSVIKFYMMYSSVLPLNLTAESEEKMLKCLRENFNMEFPDYHENICDEQKYETNLLNSLYWTHRKCHVTNSECFCYDIWAYSKIYYHLELYNKSRFDSFLQEYSKILAP
ncbi:MAG: hypothetical protein HDQ99_22310 [Lachnospiraceae bacterium]|nr:hypothetical protein [Lachnospiraceae bacterium]MBD5538323.1 hypothetical protein [Lachnospiraceae bacterium]